MDRTCSIAEARNDLSGVVREAEAGHPVILSRRGRAVAVVVSAEAFARMAEQEHRLRDAIDGFRRIYAADLDDAAWVAPRDRTPGRADWRP